MTLTHSADRRDCEYGVLLYHKKLRSLLAYALNPPHPALPGQTPVVRKNDTDLTTTRMQ